MKGFLHKPKNMDLEHQKLPNYTNAFSFHTSTPHRLRWLIMHDVGPDISVNPQDSKIPPQIIKLSRTYSLYNTTKEEFDPVWSHERDVLVSLFSHWDASKNQIDQAVSELKRHRPHFTRLLTFASKKEERDHCQQCGKVVVSILTRGLLATQKKLLPDKDLPSPKFFLPKTELLNLLTIFLDSRTQLKIKAFPTPSMFVGVDNSKKKQHI
jgi:hypothetical protein